jgi:hypothetical protein
MLRVVGLLPFALAVWLPLPAHAEVSPNQILTKQNLDFLCTKGTPRVVDRFTFAARIVAELKVPYDLMILARSDGGESGVAGYGPAEIMHYIRSDAPFGANTRPEYASLIREATRQRLEFMGALQVWFDEASKPGALYTVSSPPGTRPTVDEYFAGSGGVQIVCQPRMQDASAPAEQPAVQGSKKLYENILVRKTVSQLATPREQLKKTDGAQFSYIDDQAKDRQTFSIDGVLGYRIFGTSADRADKMAGRAEGAAGPQEQEPSYWFNLVPYIYHKKVAVRPAGKAGSEQDLLQPGMTLNLTWVSGTGAFAFDLQADASQVIDAAQDASYATGAIRLAPSFLGPNNVILLNAPLYFNFVTLRPDLAVVGRSYFIDDPGSNPELQKNDSYVSAGFDASLRMAFPKSLPGLADLTFKLDYLYRFNTNDVVDVSRWRAGISYAFPGVENLTLDLDYIDGRDEKTLIEERRWSAALAFRY